MNPAPGPRPLYEGLPLARGRTNHLQELSPPKMLKIHAFIIILKKCSLSGFGGREGTSSSGKLWIRSQHFPRLSCMICILG